MCEDWDCTCPGGCTTTQSTPAQNSSNSYDNQKSWRDHNNGNDRQYRQFTNSRYNNYGHNQNRGGGGGRGGERRGGYGRSSNRQDDPNNSMETIKIPSKYVGRVIGRGGSKISDLQFESNSKIVVTKDTEEDDTFVKISGTQDAIDKAKVLINDLTIERKREEPQQQQISQNAESVGAQLKTMSFREILQESEKLVAQEWAQYPATQKKFYKEHPEVTAMSEEEAEKFRKEYNDIQVMRSDENDSTPIPKPCITFEHAFHCYPDILDEMKKVGFERPSPIQTQAWPIIMNGEDMIGIAQTGTGKTLAFLLPALIHIEGQLSTRADRKGPVVLIMAPTRELALQIDTEVKKYEYKGINSICIYGGGNRRDQIKYVTEGVDIVIATPGRLNDLVAAGHLNIKYVTYCVLDEADRMLDLGFEPQIRKVMYAVRPDRQTIMTSATWPTGVRRLAQSYMVNPVHVHIGTLDLKATHTVKQIIEIIPDDEEERFGIFMEFMRNLTKEDKVIVFCGRKARADHITSELALQGFECQSIHGDREQADREQALRDIKNGVVNVLIATDVASRGLDIDDITHVINYDFPRSIDEYVHRIGRTGRANKTGIAISYFSRADWSVAGELIKILEEAQQYIPEDLYGMQDRYEAWKEKKDSQQPRGGGRGSRGRFSRDRW